MKYLGIFIASGALLLSGCGKTNAGGSAPQPVEIKASFPWLNKNVIGPKCLSCHGEAKPVISHETGKAVRLSSYAAVMEHIVPGDPEGSELFQDIKTGDMPQPEGNALPADIVEAFQTWIKGGAKQTP